MTAAYTHSTRVTYIINTALLIGMKTTNLFGVEMTERWEFDKYTIELRDDGFWYVQFADSPTWLGPYKTKAQALHIAWTGY